MWGTYYLPTVTPGTFTSAASTRSGVFTNTYFGRVSLYASSAGPVFGCRAARLSRRCLRALKGISSALTWRTPTQCVVVAHHSGMWNDMGNICPSNRLRCLLQRFTAKILLN